MRKAVTMLSCLLIMAVASGCKSGKNRLSCKHADEDYSGAQEVPPLKAPPGLDAPDTRNALKVPPLNTPERARGKDEPCLDAPPPFVTPKATEAQNPR